MEKFNNVKINDRVWSCINGHGTVVHIWQLENRFDVKFDDNGLVLSFAINGTRDDDDKYPTLFWNEFHLPTKEEDKPKFNLTEFVQKNIKLKEFEVGAENITFAYNYANNTWEMSLHSFVRYSTFYIETETDIQFILDTLTENNVTTEQLEEALADCEFEKVV